MSERQKERRVNSLENLETLQKNIVRYAKKHPFKVMGVSLLVGAAFAQLLRLSKSKGKNNGK